MENDGANLLYTTMSRPYRRHAGISSGSMLRVMALYMPW
jgi:hypothetical protein